MGHSSTKIFDVDYEDDTAAMAVAKTVPSLLNNKEHILLSVNWEEKKTECFTSLRGKNFADATSKFLATE